MQRTPELQFVHSSLSVKQWAWIHPRFPYMQVTHPERIKLGRVCYLISGNQETSTDFIPQHAVLYSIVFWFLNDSNRALGLPHSYSLLWGLCLPLSQILLFLCGFTVLISAQIIALWRKPVFLMLRLFWKKKKMQVLFDLSTHSISLIIIISYPQPYKLSNLSSNSLTSFKPAFFRFKHIQKHTHKKYLFFWERVSYTQEETW